ncbi:MAG TPA: pirin family protein [Candidatus Binatia bacterium]|nr:pirin family protein [Candidatus Binatia bacterium]
MSSVAQVIVPRPRDLGGFSVLRVLPAAQRQTVGPFIFLDQMGPATFAPGHGIDVRPHPHIGLATVTYLFAGEILHRDSLGTVQTIRPGDVNWMTAGRGIVHSERTPPDARATGATVSGIQAWVALPQAHEEAEPGFVHHPAASLPVIDGDGVTLRLIAGTWDEKRSPLATFSETLYADATLANDARLALPTDVAERGIYVADGRVDIAGEVFDAGRLLVAQPGAEVVVRALGAARVLVLGGEPTDGHRHIWWNFVTSSRDRLEQAKADWQAGRFPSVPGETEFTPLPAS